MKIISYEAKDGRNVIAVDDVHELVRRNHIMREALQWSYEYFLHRDTMNAKVHCAPLRLSPITERVHQAIEENDKK